MILVGKSASEVEAEARERLSLVARQERDRKIVAVQWRRDRHADEIVMGLPVTEDLVPVLEYIQALRDITKQSGFPELIIWPKEP